MSLKSLLALALGASCLFGATNVLAATAPADPGVINKEQILYWLVKRGELDAEASEEERQQALAAYTAKSTGAGSKLHKCSRPENSNCCNRHEVIACVKAS